MFTTPEENAFYAVRRTAAYWRVPATHFLLSVQGPDAAQFLHKLTTQDVLKLPLGHVHDAALLDRKGKVQALFQILRTGEAAFLLLNHSNALDLQQHLSRMRFIQRVEIQDVSERWALYWLVGPEAETKLGEALGLHGDMLIQEGKVIIPPDCAAWNVWPERQWAVPRVQCLLPQSDAERFEDIMRAMELPLLTQDAVDWVRLQVGVPEFGREISPHEILLEAPLERFFVRGKGCYPGQEVIERITAYGQGRAPRRFQTWVLPGVLPLTVASALSAQNDVIAQPVRVLFDPVAAETLVAAYLPHAWTGAALHYAADTGLQLERPQSITAR